MPNTCALTNPPVSTRQQVKRLFPSLDVFRSREPTKVEVLRKKVQTDLSLVDHGHEAFKLGPLTDWVPVDLYEADVRLHIWGLVLDPEPGAILSKKEFIMVPTW